MDLLNFEYEFSYGDNHKFNYHIVLDAKNLLLIEPQSKNSAAWTALEFHQCENCPLHSNNSPDCPIAINIAPLIEFCGHLVSFDNVEVVVTTPERKIMTKTTVQRSISSILGLIMAASDCPHMAFFRGMARFHLPFSNDQETTYRAVSAYLITQYFLFNSGKKPDLTLDGLSKIYQNLQIVNRCMAQRLREVTENDAAVNAVVLLDLFAKNIPYSVDEAIDEIRYLFNEFLDLSV